MTGSSPRSQVGIGHPLRQPSPARMIHLDTLFDVRSMDDAPSRLLPSSSVPSSPHTPQTPQSPESGMVRSCSGASIPFFYDRQPRDDERATSIPGSISGSPLGLGRDSNRPWSGHSNTSSASLSSPSFENGSSTGSTDSTAFSSEENYGLDLVLGDEEDENDVTIHGYTAVDEGKVSSVERIKYSKVSPTRMLVDCKQHSSKTIHGDSTREDPFRNSRGLFPGNYTVRSRPSTGSSTKDLPRDPSFKPVSPRQLPALPFQSIPPPRSLPPVSKSLPHIPPSRRQPPHYTNPPPKPPSKRLSSMPPPLIQPSTSRSSKLYSSIPSTTSLTLESPYHPAPTDITLQIDQEGFRTIHPLFILSPRSPNSTTSRSDILEYKAVIPLGDPNKNGYPFHLGYEKAPVIRRLCIGDEPRRDYLKRHAKLGVGTDGIWRALGGEGGESFCFVYEVADRLSLNDKVLAGEKLLRPILFLCSQNFFHPSRGRKIGLMQIAKKALTTPSTSSIVDPVSADTLDTVNTPLPISPLREEETSWMGVAL